MCGIWGIFNKKSNGFDHKEVSLVREMMILTALRGDHSTGFFSIFEDVKETPDVWKTVGDPSMFLFNVKARKFYENAWLNRGRAIVGHGRLATVGKISEENAHPFQEEGITLVHNGNISSGLHDYKDDTTSVDSHVLTKAISELGVKEALGKAFGAYAIVFHDTESGKIYFARNSQRPLHCARWGDTFLVMSELEALDYLFKRNKIIPNENKITTFAEEVIYSLDLVTMELKKDVDLKEERTKKAAASYVAPTNYGYYQGNKNVNSNGSSLVNRELPTKKKVLTFEVKDIDPIKKGRDYRYNCLSEEGLHCFFLTSEEIPGLIGRKGYGKINNLTVTDKGEYRYFIRYRMISWQDELNKIIASPNIDLTAKQDQEAIELAKKLSDGGAGGPHQDNIFLLLRSGRSIHSGIWKTVCKDQTCKSCSGIVTYDDFPEAYLDVRNRLFCPSCIDAFLSTTDHTIKDLDKIE